jgi:hypothetical protein
MCGVGIKMLKDIETVLEFNKKINPLHLASKDKKICFFESVGDHARAVGLTKIRERVKVNMDEQEELSDVVFSLLKKASETDVDLIREMEGIIAKLEKLLLVTDELDALWNATVGKEG